MLRFDWHPERPLRHFCYVDCTDADCGLIIEIGPLTIRPLEGVKRAASLAWRFLRPAGRLLIVNVIAAYLMIGAVMSLAAFVTWSAEIAAFPADARFHRVCLALAVLFTIVDMRKAARANR